MTQDQPGVGTRLLEAKISVIKALAGLISVAGFLAIVWGVGGFVMWVIR